MAKTLVIVESPAKGKTIEKFLGKDYTVRASFGHIRDLPKKNMGIDIDNNFEPTYEISADKKKNVTELKKLAKANDAVIIATDEDREGEAIGWHLCHALGLKPENTPRIVFHEITKGAITKAVENPRTVDMNLVNAQQARRLLDRIVGFKASPVLWKKVKYGLSAGRVQSVAVRLLVEKEREIQAFKPVESWKLKAKCEHDGIKFDVELAKIDSKKANLKNQEIIIQTLADLGLQVADFEEKKDKKGNIILEANTTLTFDVIDVIKKESKRKPGAPFTTSTLQQEASRKMGFSVKQTMAVAQGLYQNGHITYMRTDSVNLSKTAIDMSSKFIAKEFGEKYVVKGGRKYATKSAGAQEAHEAIRPTYIDKTPEQTGLDGNDLRLYTLIWKRTVASQMQEAIVETTTYDFQPQTNNKQIWQTKGEVITFPGFMKLYIEGSDEEIEEEMAGQLPALKKGDSITSQALHATQHFSRPPARYTEASLVKMLEKEGIGRPSTYAPTISTIMDRGYVEKEKKHLYPTDLGFLVVDFLMENFKKMMDYKFTAEVEQRFDQIAEGKEEWKQMLGSFYKHFREDVLNADEHAERVTGERLLGEDPKTKKPLIVRMGRFGPMAQIGDREDEDKKYAKLLPTQNLESITFEEALELFKLPRELGEMDGEMIKSNIGRFGPYVQLGKVFASIPKDPETGENLYDVMTITLEEAKSLIEAKKLADANKYIAEFDSGIQVLNGRYGPYIKFEKKNYKIPKDKEAEKLTEADCKEIIENTTPSGGRRKTTAKKK